MGINRPFAAHITTNSSSVTLLFVKVSDLVICYMLYWSQN